MNSTIPKESIFKLHNCDVRDLRKVLRNYQLDCKFVDVTITSPPYHDLKRYGSKDEIGYGQKYPKYLDDVTEVFRQIYDITNDSGSLWIVVDTFTKDGVFMNLPFEICEKLKQSTDEDDGWQLTDVIIWKKDKTLPWSRKGQLRNIFEYILFFTKSDNFKFYSDRIRIFDPSKLKEWWVRYPERYNAKGAVLTNVWEYPIPPQGSWSRRSFTHFNPLPRGMIERIISLTTNRGDVVFDPFAGSGSVLGVADFLERRWIGFEMKRDYCTMFREHVLGDIRKEMLVEKRRASELDELRRQFGNTIWKLRLTKFPRVLTKELGKTHPSRKGRRINTVFAISNEITNDRLLDLTKDRLTEDIFIVLDSLNGKEALDKKLRTVLSNPPLSVFGIVPNIVTLSKDEFVSLKRKSLEGLDLWLYSKCVRKFERQIAFSEWLIESATPEWRDRVESGATPIVSNLKVFKNVPKTWRSKEEQIKIAKSLFQDFVGSD
jgi:DNA modification methylase